MTKQDGPSQSHRRWIRAFARWREGAALDQAAAVFRALSDPARLRLLARLAAGEICVTELADLEKEKVTNVSARLKTLYAVRLVNRRRQAKQIFYALADPHVLDLVQSAIDLAVKRPSPTRS